MCVNVWAHAAESKGPEFGHVRDQFGFIRAMEGHADFFFPNGDLLKIQNSEILKVHITPMYHFFFLKMVKTPDISCFNEHAVLYFKAFQGCLG